MYYECSTNNKITIGRDMGWGVVSSGVMNSNVTINCNKLKFPNILNQYTIFIGN
jgi:hypothetical protein